MLSSLRRRIIVATFAMVVTVCSAFSFGLYFAFDTAEDTLFDSHLAADVASFLTLYAHDPALIDLPRENFTVYRAPRGETGGLPAYVRALQPGDDELLLGGREYHVQIEDRDGDRFYFLFDESEFEAFEQALAVSVVVIALAVIVIAAWLSAGLADRIIRPLTRLSRDVGELQDPSTTLELDPRAAPDDEIATLAGAINGYQRRIGELLEREREFSADVSHELRTPLMAIQGAAELLARRGRQDPEIGKLADRVRRGCQQMTTLTEALLYLARDPGSFGDLIEPVSVDRVVDNQVSAVGEVARSRGIELHVEHGGTGSTVQTVPAVIEIVIGNILKNAVKYTDQNIVNVFVQGEQVVIQDYGPGIETKVQSTLFDRFDRGRNRNPDGTGIGLALVRRFCDQYGWAIEFRSEERKGTRVAVAF